MKLSIEITSDERFVFAAEVGKERFNGSSGLTADLMSLFAEMLRKTCSFSRHDREAFMEDVQCRAWIEKNPQEYRDMLERIDQKPSQLKGGEAK